MGSRGKQQADIDQKDHWRSAAQDDGGDACPSQPVEGKPLLEQMRQPHPKG